MAQRTNRNAVVLVGVLKQPRDLELLQRERWYRIPAVHAPTRAYAYLAFYQPAAFGVRGKCIRYYARVIGRGMVSRRQLLPDELNHPRARERYYRIRVGDIQTLHHPIRNIIPRRVTFGFTTLHRLRSARDMLQLYRVTPIEQMVEDGLRRAGIHAIPQQVIVSGMRRCRLDFAVSCRRGAIAIECDNAASHRSPTHRSIDQRKDVFLRRHGWTVVRLTEQDIVVDLPRCIARVRVVVRALDRL
ncbi:hypothetical protein HY480_02825 [Candidatus Uhrbacteria bacterium]|nr:hypothetical protein [Candidatus Uhrbacteria bacterium]